MGEKLAPLFYSNQSAPLSNLYYYYFLLEIIFLFENEQKCSTGQVEILQRLICLLLSFE